LVSLPRDHAREQSDVGCCADRSGRAGNGPINFLRRDDGFVFNCRSPTCTSASSESRPRPAVLKRPQPFTIESSSTPLQT
jgi:hypothetical protein